MNETFSINWHCTAGANLVPPSVPFWWKKYQKHLKHFSFIPACFTVKAQCRSDFTEIIQQHKHLLTLKINDAYTVGGGRDGIVRLITVVLVAVSWPLSSDYP